MTPEDRIARLEGLLERVQRNRSQPRVDPGKPALDGVIPRAAFAPAQPAAPAPSAPVPVPRVETPPPVAAGSVWPVEPGSSIQPRPSSIPPEELTDDDLVEVTTLPPAAEEPAVTATADLELAAAAEQEAEEAPASSRRSKVAESLDQAIASAADQVEEVPIHTPPPESGPQEAVIPAGIESPRAPEFADLEAGELERPASLGPTPEQLGETIELDEPMGPELEIEVAGVPALAEAPERPVEELELPLPRAELPSGTYDRALADLSKPPTAPPPTPESASPGEAAAAERSPERIERPEVAEAEVTHVVRVRDKAPETFAELLDAALAL